MKNHFLVILIITFAQLSCAQTKPTSMPHNYEQAWKEVSDFESKGLPESALKAVNAIYEQAKKEQNVPQLVKAVSHQLKFIDGKEENAFVKNLIKLREESNAATFPTKPLLHSMLAEMYWQYIKQPLPI